MDFVISIFLFIGLGLAILFVFGNKSEKPANISEINQKTMFKRQSKERVIS